MESYVNCFASAKSNARETCSQCRWRKVRCDGRASTCGNCERLNLDCSLAAHPTQGSPTGIVIDKSDAGNRPRRLRGSIACTTCREKKVRCSATVPQCTNCKRKGHPCTYPTLKRPLRERSDVTSQDVPPSPPSVSPAIASAPTASPPENRRDSTSTSATAVITEEMISLVDAFFEHVYPMPSYAFLHPETTKRRCRQGQVHGALASAVCAIASLYMGGDRQRAGHWTDMSEQSIWINLERPTVARLQTLLLVIHYRMETGNFQRAFMLAATAARFAAAMRLNYERADLDSVGREVRRRIVWSLKIIERYFSSGLPEFELCPTESIYIEYPSPEDDFNHGPPGEHGAYRLHLRLETVRRDIMKLTRSVTILDQPLPSLMKLIRHHEASLAEIGDSLPQGRALSMSQTLDLLDNHWLPRRTLTYASWHQAHCDLYRILLPGYPEAAPSVVLEAVDPAELAAAERHCLHHATSSLQILTTLNQQSTRQQLLEFDTAICSYHAARVLLFISRFGKTPDRPAPEFAISRADLCVAALRRFFPSSALVAPIIEELTRSVGAFSEQQRQRQTRQAADSPVAPAQLLSPPSPAGRGDRESQLALTARVRQRLAIHSLLRRADFSDGDGDDEVAPTDTVPDMNHTAKSTSDAASKLPTARSPLPADNPSPARFGTKYLAPEDSRVHRDVTSWDVQSVNGNTDDSPESTHLPPMSWFGPQDWDWLTSPKV